MRAAAGLAGFPNFRAFGGQRTQDGRTVRRGLIYRSEALLRPDATDAAVLAGLGIALVCDLRSDAERDRAPNRWWAERGVPRLDVDLLDALPRANRPWPILRRAPDAAGTGTAMRAVYAGLPTAALPHVGPLLRRIGDGALPLLIHCTAGKDRTGFMSALLLAALDVPLDAIVADYLASRIAHSAEAIAATRALALANGVALPPDALAVMMGVDESYLREAFAAIDRDHGDVAGYLRAAGLGAAEVAAVRRRLLADPGQPIT